MSILILTIEGEPFVQAVHLDDPSPGYAESYAGIVKRYLEPSQRDKLRWSEVDVSPVSEYGPNDIADFLSVAGQEKVGITDLPQRWEQA